LKQLKSESCDVRLMASDDNWIEGPAVDQLLNTAKLKGMVRAVGMPDLHPGRGNPIGAVFCSKGIIYPYLVGGDIGCGMGLWQTALKVRKLRQDKWVKKLTGLDDVWNGDQEAFVEKHKLNDWDDALGTIGGGNHFAELQKIEQVFDKEKFNEAGLQHDLLQLMVHSGSRGLGQSVLRGHTSKYGDAGLEDTSESAEVYLQKHDYAVKWSSANRELIAARFMKSINTSGSRITDICHNSVTKSEYGWLHRKGAAPTDSGLVLIPGSRGALSYIVEAVGDQSQNCSSLAHGAGRKWNRKSCRERFSHKYSVESLRQTKMGGRVICANKDLLFEEAPMAYKDITVVIQDMVDDGVINVIASLKPLITYKTRQR
jgi:release factor H-coupled RctB family protein